MCLAIPMRVNKLLNLDEAVVEMDGIQKRICISLLDDVSVGDFVIVHVGYALNKIDPLEAEKTLSLFAQWADEK